MNHNHVSNPIPPLEWDSTILELGKALEELARTATDAELAALVHHAGVYGVSVVNQAAASPATMFVGSVASVVLGRELAARHGLESDLVQAWSVTLIRLLDSSPECQQ